jgi:hypothetical protein
MAETQSPDLVDPVLAPLAACGGLVAPYRVVREQLVFPEPQATSAQETRTDAVDAKDQQV